MTAVTSPPPRGLVLIAIGLAVFVPLAGLAAGGSTDDKVKLAQLLLPIATTAPGALAGLLAPSPAATIRLRLGGRYSACGGRPPTPTENFR